ncbi:MAG: bifunctional diaminohydroxyphosphoribosylaminopyrimidine deaminase/5-amino-6-(5-phosphoribosylamino)uracil reductase RibD [Acidimicrobiia bacterium]|nr:bifunctional diaminohydroxyphosphoribosylaminopyrimidine deaminase/5-amino-6-(5-phosphoribosylamino)uracil reductase RibD [Acidimicrobiia bacterium]
MAETAPANSFLEEALVEARKGTGLTSPNPMVGALLVHNGRVVGRGHHTWEGMKHAEVLALEQAGELARGATMYINLEPCCHQGRTGPCTQALIDAGVKRVVAAMADPNPLVSGKGFAELRKAGVEVEIDKSCTPEAEKLNEPFVHFMRTGRPLVMLKAALTLDGKIAAPEDNRGWITSERSRAHVQELRHASDAILTGIGTLLADDCLLTDRSLKPRHRPLLRIVMDSQLRIPLQSRMVESAQGDVLVVTTSAASAERRRALEERGVEVLVCDGANGRADLGLLVEALAVRKHQSLMMEGGSKINWAALEAGVVDKVFFYYAPKILGGTQSLPVAGGTGRLSRKDALVFRDVKLHPIPPDEFAVEAWLEKS